MRPNAPEPRERDPSTLARVGMRVGRAMVGRRFTSQLDEMKRAQWLSADELAARQAARLRSIVEHAFTHVPFWRETARALGLAAGDIRSTADLHTLPTVDKATFRAHPLEHFLAENVPAWRQLPYTTSGSTGDPFRFVLDRKVLPLVFASHLFYDSWFGLDPMDRSIRIMGAPVTDPPPRGAPLRARVRGLATRRLQRAYERRTQRRLQTFDADPDRVEREIEAFRPAYLLGYTATLAEIAAAFLRRGYRPPRPLKAVVTIAETLTPERRELIESCFGAPIANRYGQRELKFWCAQSPEDDPTRFLVNTELVVWESLRRDGTRAEPDEIGRVVLTDLHNEVMPFLRYETGDLAVLAPDATHGARGFPVVTRLDSRTQEVLRTPAGRTIDATTLGHHLFVLRGHVDDIRAYQLIQDRADAVRLCIVPTAACTADLERRLREDLAALLGDEIEISIEPVADIPLERSGKRPIIKTCPAEPTHVR